ncbi:MAG TPA: toprim domain-containing protein [Kiritimatiellia bacterium]|nr:toprim domain-containing protein [Kiritimatiellia bacterium]HRU70520.1 toprim domain-containing protein [Kiritimatiellia bacterium]
MSASTYDDKHIQTLSAIEHIRKRTGMYIGRTSDGGQYEDGIYILLKEVIDNAVDEFIMGYGKRVEISLSYNTGEVTVRDYGRGIPLGKVVECVSQINTGGKFSDDVFQFSVGMNGVGTKAVNALSTEFEVRAFRDGEYSEALFQRGQLISQKRGKCTSPQRNGTYVRFTPDPDIFKKYQFREEHVLRRLRMYAYLNAGLTLELNGNRIVSENGLLDLIHDEAQFEKLYQPFHYRSKTLELVFTHTNRFSEEYYSFVNGQFTNDGGTHLSAFKEGLLKAVNEFSKKKFDGDDVREGIIGAIAIRLKDPIFESQTKNKLGNQEIRSDLVAEIKRVVEEMLHREPAEAAKLISKVEETGKLRAELNAVKKLARERSRAVSVRVPQLKDCKRHLNKQKGTGLDTMIFITEGQSAAGSIVSCRDVNTQAIFTLKGKPLNVCDAKRDALYKNVEIYNLMQSLDIEESVDRLRYQKVILATDADVDGLHIRNLMITLFLRFFDRVIKEGHLYLLETPLFRVRNKKQTFYCYSEEERLAAIAACGKNPEITRFKGLGEISPDEFKNFIGKSMRLTPVDSTRDRDLKDTVEFYMGRNTQERRQYIMDNLVITEESLS